MSFDEILDLTADVFSFFSIKRAEMAPRGSLGDPKIEWLDIGSR